MSQINEESTNVDETQLNSATDRSEIEDFEVLKLTVGIACLHGIDTLLKNSHWKKLTC